MLFRPLCPPGLPSGLSLSLESGRARSSSTTRIFSTAIRSLSIQYFTAWPDRFIKVVGLIHTSILPFHFSSTTAANRPTSNRPPNLTANASTTSNPILCRVPAYSSPILPRPAIRNFVAKGLPISIIAKTRLTANRASTKNKFIFCPPAWHQHKEPQQPPQQAWQRRQHRPPEQQHPQLERRQPLPVSADESARP